MTQTEHATPEEAEAAFYDAFQARDLNAMMNVWADREFIECIHPMSDRAQGRHAVKESWRQIFDAGIELRLELSDVHRTQDALIAVHIVYEHLSIAGQSIKHPPIIATNVYQLIDGSWRLVLHHASPSPDDAQADEEELLTETPDSHRLH